MAERLSRAWLVLLLPLLLVAATDNLLRRGYWLTDRFFAVQDLPVVGIIAIAAVAIWVWKRVGRRAADHAPLHANPPGAPPAASRALGWRTSIILAVAAAVFSMAVAAAGVSVIFENFPLSMDEFLANFDAVIIGHGQIMAPVAPGWRSFVPALQTMFTLPTLGNAFLASDYLPMNAALRALADKLDGGPLLNPALAGLCIGMTFVIARRLWPTRPDLALIAAALLATSGQFLLTAMTPYAMTAHLACNLVWLWLFLRGGVAHAGALIVAFIACGLHQLIFHPLFAAPFIVQLWAERRWRTAALYTLSYGAIGLFWAEWPSLALEIAGAQPAAGAPPGTGALASRAVALVLQFDPRNSGAMAKNLIRFISWQNLMTAPLAIVAFVPAVRAKGVLRSLAAGLALTAGAMFILLPYQGHGWGYRYLHGLMGSTCLLAAFGWAQVMRGTEPRAMRAAGRTFILVGSASALVLLPVRALQAHRFLDPYARSYAAIRSAHSQIVFVDSAGIRFGRDLVRNDPYLRNRPLILGLGALTAAQTGSLCARFTVALFDLSDARRLGVPTVGSAAQRPSKVQPCRAGQRSAPGRARSAI